MRESSCCHFDEKDAGVIQSNLQNPPSGSGRRSIAPPRVTATTALPHPSGNPLIYWTLELVPFTISIWKQLGSCTATTWRVAGVVASIAVIAAVATWFLSKAVDTSRDDLEAKIAKSLKKRPAVLVDAFDGREIRHWKEGGELKLSHKAWIHAHTSEEDIRPMMPQLELHLAPSVGGPIQAKLRVEYVRGNGKRSSRTTDQDRVSIPRDGSFRNLEGNTWVIHEDPDFLEGVSQDGFFGGDAVLTWQAEGSEEQTIRFRIGGENPGDEQCTQFIHSFPGAKPGGELDFMCAIARHESKHKNRSNVYYNQFLQWKTLKGRSGLPVWNNDGGSTPGGYGVFQVTGTDEDPLANIPRDQIWNWQSNVRAAFGIITHQFKGSLAKRYFQRIENRYPQGEQLLEQCPPPDITVGGETFTAHQAIWITAYNGWGGNIQNRFIFSKDNPCGLGPGKRWQWNPPVKPNGKTYLRLIAEEME